MKKHKSSEINILLIEDNKKDATAFSRSLKNSEVNFNVNTVQRGEDAIDLLDEDNFLFEIVIADHGLPGISGLDLCKFFLDKEVPVPLVILIDAGNEQFAVEAIKAGVQDYIVKNADRGYLKLLPILIPEIIRRYNDHIVRSEIEDDFKKKNIELISLNKELKVTQKALKKKTKELDTSNKYKSEFMANMSHELRTPLNSLLILAQSLKRNRDGNLTKEQIELIDIIYRSGNTLLMLINDILDLSKIDAGKMSVYVSETSLSEIAEDIDSMFRHITEEKGIDFNIFIDKGLPELIKTEQQKLKQIMRNFISNAVKFTSKGAVKVYFSRPGKDVKLTKGVNRKKTIAFSVEDTGIGIREDKQRKIFRSFHQGDGSTRREYGGTGLGLSISKELAKLLRGEIEVTSKYGKGSKFTLYIPEDLKVSKKTMPERRFVTRPHLSILNQDGAIFTGKKILIADDDMRNLYTLSKIIQDTGAKVYKAANGKRVLENLEKVLDINLVLMDLIMPEMDGYEALKQIRSHNNYKDLPVFAVTAKTISDENYNYDSIGANEYITKPIDIDRLFSLMKVWLSKNP